MPGKIQRTPFSRVWLIEDRAGPANAPEYMNYSRAMSPAWPQGDVTPVRVPDPDTYGQFLAIDETRGAQGLPALPIEARYGQDISTYLKLVRKGCRVDLQAHLGECRDPRDFNGGWHKVLVLEAGRPTQWGTSELGALDPSQDAVITESIPFTGLDLYEVKRLRMAEFGGVEIVQEVVAVAICDSKTCGECGLTSDGCQKIFALTLSAGGSPGLPAALVYSEDQGATLGTTHVSTLGAAEDPTGMACVGVYLVVISDDSCSLHYAEIADILDGVETWTEISTGFTCPTGAPLAIFSLGSTFTWIVGKAGRIYFASDVTTGVTIQDAGVATTQDLNDIHGIDELHLVAVGKSNAVVVTQNGGSTWSSVTGPAVGVELKCVWMRTKDEWFVGTAAGTLWYTRDGGTSWTRKAFPGSGAGIVRDIQFATPTVGYMSHDTATPAGRILRTIDGGYSWYVLPEDPISFPANDRINSIAACGEDPNFVLGGGLADAGLDGFLVKGA